MSKVIKASEVELPDLVQEALKERVNKRQKEEYDRLDELLGGPVVESDGGQTV